MGAISIDIYKKEREFEHLTLSDINVVKYLILFRCNVDSSYGSTINRNSEEAGDTFEFNQQLIILYASLDDLVKQCKFKEKNTKLLELLYEGYTISDVCGLDIGYKKSATHDLLDRMIHKIVATNKTNWQKTMLNLGYLHTTTTT